MTSLDEELLKNNETKFRSSKNMTVSTAHSNPSFLPTVNESICRGALLRYSLVLPEVRDRLKDLKASNPKYLTLLNKIIKASIIVNDDIDIDMVSEFDGKSILAMLLDQFNFASYNNFEVLDFTSEVIDKVDNLTAKYYLSYMAAGMFVNTSLKSQFKAATPFIKYLVSETLYSDSKDFSAQKSFMTGIKCIINEKADVSKIELLPRLKNVVDFASKKDYNIDVVKFIYSHTPTTFVKKRLETLSSMIKSSEKANKSFDCVDYLIQNSL